MGKQSDKSCVRVQFEGSLFGFRPRIKVSPLSTTWWSSVVPPDLLLVLHAMLADRHEPLIGRGCARSRFHRSKHGRSKPWSSSVPFGTVLDRTRTTTHSPMTPAQCQAELTGPSSGFAVAADSRPPLYLSRFVRLDHHNGACRHRLIALELLPFQATFAPKSKVRP